MWFHTCSKTDDCVLACVSRCADGEFFWCAALGGCIKLYCSRTLGGLPSASVSPLPYLCLVVSLGEQSSGPAAVLREEQDPHPQVRSSEEPGDGSSSRHVPLNSFVFNGVIMVGPSPPAAAVWQNVCLSHYLKVKCCDRCEERVRERVTWTENGSRTMPPCGACR